MVVITFKIDAKSGHMLDDVQFSKLGQLGHDGTSERPFHVDDDGLLYIIGHEGLVQVFDQNMRIEENDNCLQIQGTQSGCAP